MLAIASIWAVSFAAYLALTGAASADEMAAGAFCAAATVAWSVGVRRAGAQSFAFDAASFANFGRAWLGLPKATLLVAVALIRALFRPHLGEVAHSKFPHGRFDDAKARGRRAIDVLATSLAPDGFVMRTPAARDEIVVHRVCAGKRPLA